MIGSPGLPYISFWIYRYLSDARKRNDPKCYLAYPAALSVVDILNSNKNFVKVDMSDNLY